MKKLLDKIKAFAKKVISYTQRKSIRKNITIFDFFQYFIEGIKNESLTIRASALAFKLFLSLFPAMIFLVTLLPYVYGGQLKDVFLETAGRIMPEYSFKAIEPILKDFLDKPKFGLLSISFLLSFFYSISNMYSIINTFNLSYHLTEKRSFLKKTFIAFILTIIFFALLIIALLLIIINENLIEWLMQHNFLSEYIKESFYFGLLKYGKWFVLFFVLVAGLSIFYTYLPAEKIKFRLFSPGSLFSGLFFILVSLLFNFFVNYFSSYNKIYGILGVVLVFFIWLYYISLIILIGFEINASLYIAPVKKEDIVNQKLTFNDEQNKI